MTRRKKSNSNRRFLIGIFLIAALAIGGRYAWKKLNRSPAPIHFIELPENFKSYGIDVSHHQNKIDWDVLLSHSDSLIAFVYCKATEGTDHVDTQWERNRQILLEKNIANGAYHFFLPNKSAIKQAKHFLTNYQLNKNDLPPVLDVEIEGNSDEQLVAQMKIWLDYIELKTGRRPIIYTSYNLYRKVMKSNFSKYKFWVANYNTIESRFVDEEIIHWQYSDNGKLNGINGKVDLNFSKIEF